MILGNTDPLQFLTGWRKLMKASMATQANDQIELFSKRLHRIAAYVVPVAFASSRSPRFTCNGASSVHELEAEHGLLMDATHSHLRGRVIR
jgi:hypothetical protein